MKTSTIHQAGNQNFDPANYEFIDCADLLEGEGGSFANCEHCGKAIRYVAVLKHLTTGEEITVGETCLDSRFGITRAEFDALRAEGKLNAQRKKFSQRKADFIAEFPVVQTILDRSSEHYLLSDLAHKFELYAQLSTKQMALAEKLFVQVDEFKVRQAQRDAQEAELIAQGVKIPTGRAMVTGTVLSTKFEDGQFGFTAKMLVQDDAGWKVWCSIPEFRDLPKGARVRFSVDITPKTDLFGFGKRPTKFEWFDANNNNWTKE